MVRLGKTLLPFALAWLLWLLGWRTVAVVIVAATVVLTLLALLFASVRRRLDAVLGAVSRAVGSVLTTVLLAAVHLLIFTPVWALARLLRIDLLDPLKPRRAWRTRRTTSNQAVTSRWVVRTDPTPRPLPERPYADERFRYRDQPSRRGAAPFGSLRWIRAFVGGLVLLLAADVAIGTVFSNLGSDGTSAGSATTPSSFDPVAQEALASQEGAAATMQALVDAGIGTPHPFIGWRFDPDYGYESKYVNIADGARLTVIQDPEDTSESQGTPESRVTPKSQDTPDSQNTAASAAEPTGPTEPGTAEIWFFGGSTMYGSGQRDHATIASVLVRRLAEAGSAATGINYGHPAYSNRQSVLLLEERLIAGGRPDLVVFYDGFNDLNLQLQFGVHDEATHLFFDPNPQPASVAQPTVQATLRGWWADHSAVNLARRRVAGWFGDEKPVIVTGGAADPARTAAGTGTRTAADPGTDPAVAAEAAVAIHRAGLEHVLALARAYDFEARFFWQPYLYTKDPLTTAESELVGLPGYDFEVFTAATSALRAGLAAPVIDLSDVFDGLNESLFWDFVHSNERGAQIVAGAMLGPIREALASRQGEAG